MLNDQEYLKLVPIVNQYRNSLHIDNNEAISESALDDLKHKVTQYEVANPTKISLNSPNYTIAGGISKGFQKYQHKHRMLSLNDIFDYQELIDWSDRNSNYSSKNTKNQEIIDPNITEFICEPKIDGLAISLIYQEGLLIRGVTRGDGYEGEDVTANIIHIQSIPNSIPSKESIEIRGEIFMTQENFQKLNQGILEGKLIGKMGKTGRDGLFANSRNVASGTIRQLDTKIVGERNLSFIAYNVGRY